MGAGHWNAESEFQFFRLSYRAIPTYSYRTGYGEVRRVIHPRLYIAARAGYLHPMGRAAQNAIEAAVGFRPNSWQLIKAGYRVLPPNGTGKMGKVFAVQLVTTLPAR